MGVTFECDYPPEAREKAVVVKTELQPELPEREIDRQVNEASATGRSLYRLDADKLREIKPDLIVTQNLCHVCAASPNDLGAILPTLSPTPTVLSLSPRTLADVWNDISAVGMATDRMAEARELVAKLKTEITNVTKTHSGEAPRVLCLEWLDPPFVAGHWVPEMVAIAGGVDVLGRAGEPGVPVSWERIVSSDPDLILAMPCGYHREKIESELKIVPFPPAWYLLRAVRSGNLFAMDASSHFSRPGPRLADGIVAMAEIFRRHGSAQSRKAPSGEKKYRVRYQVGNQR